MAEKVAGSSKGAGAAGTGDAGQRVINRYHHAVEYTRRLQEVGKNEMFPLTNCPEEFSLGYRCTRSSASNI